MSQPGSQEQFSLQALAAEMQAVYCPHHAGRVLLEHAGDVVAVVAPELDASTASALELGASVHGLIQQIPQIPFSPGYAGKGIPAIVQGYASAADRHIRGRDKESWVKPGWAAAFALQAVGTQNPDMQLSAASRAYIEFMPTWLD
jgi:hypothetical protein